MDENVNTVYCFGIRVNEYVAMEVTVDIASGKATFRTFDTNPFTQSVNKYKVDIADIYVPEE